MAETHQWGFLRGDRPAGSPYGPLIVAGTVSTTPPAGAATEAKQDTIITHVDGLEGLVGAINSAPPGTDTADASLNGRLQRVAQRLTSLIALLPSSLGQKTKANSLAVTLASDSDALAVTQAIGQGQTLQYGEIDTAASGVTQLVAAQGAGNRVYVVSYAFVCDGAVTVEFRSAAAGISGAMSCAANGGVSAIGQPAGPLMRTVANEALNINLGGAVGVRGHFSYFVAT